MDRYTVDRDDPVHDRDRTASINRRARYDRRHHDGVIYKSHPEPPRLVRPSTP